MLPRHSVLINADRKRIQSKLFLALTSLPSCKSVAVVSSDVNQQITSIHNITLKYETTRPFAQISERKLMLGATGEHRAGGTAGGRAGALSRPNPTAIRRADRRSGNWSLVRLTDRGCDFRKSCTSSFSSSIAPKVLVFKLIH